MEWQTKQELEAIRKRLMARTAGPLTLDRVATDGPGLPFKIMAYEPGRGERVHLTSPAGLRHGDAVFHANAPKDIEYLLTLVELLQAEIRGREPGS